MYTPDLNKIELLGNVGKDPIIKKVSDSLDVAEIFVATNRKTANSEILEVDWHKVCAFGSLADICREYIKQGARVFVEGRVQQTRYIDSDNKVQFRIEIIANKILRQPINNKMEEEVTE